MIHQLVIVCRCECKEGKGLKMWNWALKTMTFSLFFYKPRVILLLRKEPRWSAFIVNDTSTYFSSLYECNHIHPFSCGPCVCLKTNIISKTDPSDLLRPREAVLLKVIGQVQEGVSLQVLAVTEDDEQTLLLQTQNKNNLMFKWPRFHSKLKRMPIFT